MLNRMAPSLMLVVTQLISCASTEPQKAFESQKASIQARIFEALAKRPRNHKCRLSWPLAFRPYDDQHSESLDAKIELIRLRQELESLWKAERNPSLLPMLAAASLHLGEADEAMAILSRARIEQPENPNVLNDQACAVFVKAQWTKSPENLFQTFELLDDALSRAPHSPVLLFNQAIALQELHLPRETKTAWESCLKQEASPQWKQEALAFKMAQARPSKGLGEIHSELVAFGGFGGDKARNLIAENLEMCRKLFEETLLFEWLGASTQEAGREVLALMQLIASVEFDLTGDRLLSDIANNAASLNGGSLIRQGLEQLKAGWALFRKQDYAQAEPLLVLARKKLQDAQSASHLLAGYLLAVCQYQTNQAASAEAIASELEKDSTAKGYLALLARVYSLQAVIEVQYKRDSNKYLALKEKALDLANATESAALAGKIHSDIGVLLNYLFGRSEEAWGHHAEALCRIAAATDPRMQHGVYQGAADLALSVNAKAAASALQREALASAERYGSAAAITRSLLTLARIEILRSRFDSALPILDRIRETAANIPTPTNRLWVDDDILAARAELVGPSQPQEGLRQIEAALAIAYRQGVELEQLRYSRFRALMLARLGRLEDSLASLIDSIEGIESIRSSLNQATDQIDFFDTVHKTFDDAVNLASRPGLEIGLDFELSERSRFRTFKDRLFKAWGQELSFRRCADLQEAGQERVRWILRRLPRSAAIVQYHLLADRVVLWLLSDNRIRRFHARVAAGEVERRVDALGLALLSKTMRPDAELLLKWLGQILLEPLGNSLNGKSWLIFVPDKALGQVPFSHLPLPGKGDYLFEQASVSVAPGSALAILAEERLASLGPAARQVLAVGNPRFDRARYPNLSALPQSASEALHIRQIYPEGQLLLGAEATTDRFLDQLKKSEVLSYSGHARADLSNPQNSALFLAYTEEDTGVLNAEDLSQARFEGLRLAVLAACDTAHASSSTSEGFPGLAAAFLVAGTPAVLASLWPLEDSSSGSFLESFHRRYREHGQPGRALSQSRRDWLNSGGDPLASAALQLFGASGWLQGDP